MADANPAPATSPLPQANSITSDRGLLNQQVNKLANEMTTNNDAIVTALDAIVTAINAKPSA